MNIKNDVHYESMNSSSNKDHEDLQRFTQTNLKGIFLIILIVCIDIFNPQERVCLCCNDHQKNKSIIRYYYP